MGLLAENPAKRLTADGMLQHKWFQTVAVATPSDDAKTKSARVENDTATAEPMPLVNEE
eukprot:CAMPEP_0185623216 /NCGR_PEP_ID=MMETSP0436-20130131/59715_1 /TAXON_ID=626734 ORGANISM="Favella taraikaensis, Strain Fe Narragansett Bay" /NCGR_SAMPLE_ID=MMETSP0436 /ASSEMBLY_ACC=CAM_ASM_000390 /LENGTH=58 /DNA_ID=CAMNT_0028265157 /DNA_START=893 /DNA_END=1069 /DNA_ORIENTATION=-